MAGKAAHTEKELTLWIEHIRPTDPGPQGLSHFAQAQAFSTLQKIDDRTVVAIVAHREVEVMAVAVQLDDDTNPPLRRNNYGVTIGGPIRKNKTCFQVWNG